MDEHVRRVGDCFIGLGLIGALVAVILWAVYGGWNGLLAVDLEARRNALDTIPMINLVACAYFILGLLLALPLITVGLGVRRRRPWARTGGILLGAATLLFFPVGTLIGLYSIWVLILPETEPLFLPPSLARRH